MDNFTRCKYGFLPVSISPFEVIEKRPSTVANYITIMVVYGIQHFGDIFLKKLY